MNISYNLRLGDLQQNAQNNSTPFKVSSIDIPKTNTKLMAATDYTRLDHRSQIYKEPDMYLGSITKHIECVRVLDFTDQSHPKFVNCDMDFPDGCKRIILEPLYNATDNVWESIARNHPPGEIFITMKDNIISIRNGGIPIPVVINETEKMWTPQMIFATLLTSGQYKKAKKTGSGKNGYGAKLTNIFSKWLRIIVGDPYNKRHYVQDCEQNMTIIHNPKITEGYNGEPFVEISFLMDFARFGYTEYPSIVASWLAATAAELSFTVKVPVTFNGYKFDIKNVLEFKELTTHVTDNYLIHYEYPEGTELKSKKMPNGTMTKIAVNDKIQPLVELCIIDTPDHAEVISFANSANTREGGVHVDAVYDNMDIVITAVNNSIKSKKDDKLTRGQALNKGDLKRHLTIIISCTNLEDPLFTSNEKVKLTTPKPKIKLDDNIIKKIMATWELNLRLLNDLNAKLNKGNKDSKNKRKYLSFEGYDPANNSGVKGESHKCVLYEVEGLSAMGYAYNMKSEMVAEQRDYVGIFAQMGKPMNVRIAKMLKYANSEKIQRFLLALGLDPAGDPDYTKEENFMKLNYGMLALLNDADVDGKHISGLVLNIIYCRYRSLLRRNFVVMIRTPIIRITNGKLHYKFYSRQQYDKHIREYPDHIPPKWETNYYKGLAGSDENEVAEETKNPKIAYLIYDDTTPDAFDLVFSNAKGQSDKRKEWIAKFDLHEDIEELKMLPISMFLNKEVLQHAQWSMARTIPRFDGLKNGQRKIIYGSFDEWKAGTGTSTKKVKTDHLKAHVSKVTDYIHGEKSLVDTINRMILSYPGSNNLRFFYPKGQFGTRNKGGLDAGESRYTHAYPEWWWPYMFRKEDMSILIFLDRDGKTWEPEFYLPILPLFMVNGCLGIGTGSSTFIPHFNPVDLYNAILSVLAGIEPDQLIPWYRGFKGKVEVKSRDASEMLIQGTVLKYDLNLGVVAETIDAMQLEEDEKKSEETQKMKEMISGFRGTGDDEDDEIDLENVGMEDVETDENGDPIGKKSKKKGGLKMMTYGIWEKLGKDIFVSEVPIGKSFDQFKAFLEILKEKKELKDYKADCTKNEARFTLKGFKPTPSYESLGLIKTYSLTNMVLLDEKDRRIKFSTPNELIKEWVKWRLPFYQNRKENMLKELKDQIVNKQHKIKFISCVLDGIEHGYIPGRNIIIMKAKKSDVYAQMEVLGIPSEHYKGTGSDKYSTEEIQNLQNKVQQFYNKYQQLEVIKIEQMFINDLNEFIGQYLKEYPEEKSRKKF